MSKTNETELSPKRDCPDCRNFNVVTQDGYCGSCRQCTLSAIPTPSAQTDKCPQCDGKGEEAVFDADEPKEEFFAGTLPCHKCEGSCFITIPPPAPSEEAEKINRAIDVMEGSRPASESDGMNEVEQAGWILCDAIRSLRAEAKKAEQWCKLRETELLQQVDKWNQLYITDLTTSRQENERLQARVKELEDLCGEVIQCLAEDFPVTAKGFRAELAALPAPNQSPTKESA